MSCPGPNKRTKPRLIFSYVAFDLYPSSYSLKTAVCISSLSDVKWEDVQKKASFRGSRHDGLLTQLEVTEAALSSRVKVRYRVRIRVWGNGMWKFLSLVLHSKKQQGWADDQQTESPRCLSGDVSVPSANTTKEKQ